MSRGRSALLFLLALGAAWAGLGAELASSQQQGVADPVPPRAILVLTRGLSFEEVLAVPEFRALARAGGAALLTTRTGSGKRYGSAFVTVMNGAVTPDSKAPSNALEDALLSHHVDLCTESSFGPVSPAICHRTTRPALFLVDDTFPYASSVAALLRRYIQAISRPTLVVVASIIPSQQMDRVGDQVTGIVMAMGIGDRLLAARGPIHALTSGTTRTDGVVANVDVAPTILRFFGVPIPSSMDGAPITVTGKPAPFALHRLHLEQRRVRLPVDLGEVAFIAAVGIAGILVLLLMGSGGSVAPGVARTMRFLALATTAFPLVALGGGLLPRMTYAVVVPYMVLATAGLAWLSQRVKWPGTLGPFFLLGTVTLSFVVIDGLFGGNAYRIPLYGNTVFDGARFYGISNSFISLLLASAIFVAYGLPTRAGMAVLFATGLFAGFPDLGANVGASITLFAAAGLWWAIRTRRRADPPSVAVGVAATGAAIVLGLAIVFAVNRIAPGGATHATRFVERAGGNARYGLETIRRRLAVGVSQFGHVPAAWVPILGLPIVLAVVLRGPGPVGPGLRTIIPAWRDGIVVLILSAIVAYVANDTGVAAAGPAFLYAMAMMAYPAFLSGGRRRPEPGRPASEPASAAR